MDVTTIVHSAPYREYSLYRALKEERVGFYSILIKKDESTQHIIERTRMDSFKIEIPKDYAILMEHISIERDDVRKEVRIRPVPFVYILLHKTKWKWYAVKHWIKEKLGMS